LAINKVKPLSFRQEVNTQICFPCPNFLLGIIDKQRGEYTRNEFIKLAIAIATKTKLAMVRQPGKTTNLLLKT